MKKIFSILALGILLSSCADSKVIDGKVYEPYGWGNYQTQKNDSILYEPVLGNIIWSVLLCETIVAPVYFTGWSIMEPVEKKQFSPKLKVNGVEVKLDSMNGSDLYYSPEVKSSK